jgi:EpsI family protein
MTVNRYTITKGQARRLVLYWYQAHGRVVASEYWGELYLVTDAIQMNRTDEAFVRIVTPWALDEPMAHVEKRAGEFAENLIPLLGEYLP